MKELSQGLESDGLPQQMFLQLNKEKNPDFFFVKFGCTDILIKIHVLTYTICLIVL